jgi:hypothetical protein
MSRSAGTATTPQLKLKKTTNNTEQYETNFNIDGGSDGAAHHFVFAV